MKIEIQSSLSLIRSDQKPVSLMRGMHLLRLIEKTGNLHAASNSMSLSYRMARDTLMEMETPFGAPVIDGTPGKGSELTALGKRLVHIDKLV